MEDVGQQLVTADHRGVEEKLFQKETKNLVHKRLKEMPENYRDVVYGYYIEEKSFQQLAEEQQIKEKSVRVKLHRARNWMREHWKEDDFL